MVPTPEPTLGKAVRLTAAVVTEAQARATDSRSGTLQWGPDACP
ncbi:hypothetical protein [Hyalangium gracile]|nr:hypothetical protein [Hyalangium gracile]